MTRTLTATTLVVLGGGLVASALFWGFLNTPESTIWALALSAVLAVGIALAVAATVTVVLLAWARQGLSRAVARDAARGLPAFLLPSVAAAAIWWLALRADAWLSAYSGEISAWFIARFGWADMEWLFRVEAWVSAWVRWVVAPFVALVWWRTILLHGWRPTRTLLRDALSPVGLLAATAIVAVFVWVPWTQLVPWRPRALAPGTLEFVFVGAKLGLVIVLMALASSLVARVATSRRN